MRGKTAFGSVSRGQWTKCCGALLQHHLFVPNMSVPYWGRAVYHYFIITIKFWLLGVSGSGDHSYAPRMKLQRWILFFTALLLVSTFLASFYCVFDGGIVQQRPVIPQSTTSNQADPFRGMNVDTVSGRIAPIQNDSGNTDARRNPGTRGVVDTNVIRGKESDRAKDSIRSGVISASDNSSVNRSNCDSLVHDRIRMCNFPGKSVGGLYDDILRRLFTVDLDREVESALNSHIGPNAASYRPLRVLVNGERHHGTNWLTSLIQDNIAMGNGLKTKEVSNIKYGWKHWEFTLSPQHLNKLESENDVIVVLVRNPYQWLPKIFFESYLVAWPPKGISFQCMLREPYRETKFTTVVNDSNHLERVERQTRGAPTIMHRLVEKMDHWLHKFRNATDRVYFLRYEKLRSDTEGELRKLARTYGLVMDDEFKHVDKYRGFSQVKDMSKGIDLNQAIRVWCQEAGIGGPMMRRESFRLLVTVLNLCPAVCWTH